MSLGRDGNVCTLAPAALAPDVSCLALWISSSILVSTRLPGTRFSTSRRVWLDAGGVYVDANLRGGGEYGDAWHKAGNLTRKQNVFDDFVACARHLIEAKYTSPDRLAIEGGSNGGLLMGVALTQHPELYNAIVIQVPLFDMIGYTHIGAGASWVGEYGDPAIPAERKVLESYSPYQNLKPGQPLRYRPERAAGAGAEEDRPTLKLHPPEGEAVPLTVEVAFDCRYSGQSHELTVAAVADFPAEHARRLAAILPAARVELVPDSRTWIMLDQPERTAHVSAELARRVTARQAA